MSNLKRRQAELAKFLEVLKSSADRLSVDIEDSRTKVLAASENADEPFADSLRAVENFLRNVNFAQAAILVGRYATAETSEVNE